MGRASESDDSSADIEAHAVEHQHNSLSLEKTVSQSGLSQRSIHANPPQSHVSRFLSRVRTADSIPLAPPPDGGVRAWSTACLTHLVLFNTWGFVNSFGVFQLYYVNNMNLGSNSAISWIGSIQIFLVFGMGTFTGRALDGGWFRLVFWTGSVIYLFGLCMLSLCTTYWQVFLTHGVCVGFGFGLVFVPSIGLTSTYFSHKKRAMAIAIAVCGSSSGGWCFQPSQSRCYPRSDLPGPSESLRWFNWSLPWSAQFS